MAGTSPAMTMNLLLNPLQQLADHQRDPPGRREHLVHDGKMVGAWNLLIADGKPEPGAVAGKIRGLLAQ